MASATPHGPVFLLLGKRTGSNDCFDEWLAASRFSACEAEDVFQALEHASDFTQAERPDVVFLHLDCETPDRQFIHSVVATSKDELAVPIIDLTGEDPIHQTTEDIEATLAGLASQLDKFIPKHHSARV